MPCRTPARADFHARRPLPLSSPVVLVHMVPRKRRHVEDAGVGSSATIRRSTVLLGGVEPVVPNRRDELAAVPDVIGTDGDEDFSAFATSRWPGLVRLAFGLTGDRWLAEDMAQTALARAYVAWRRVSQADDPDAYLRRILVNASQRRVRRRRV